MKEETISQDRSIEVHGPHIYNLVYDVCFSSLNRPLQCYEAGLVHPIEDVEAELGFNNGDSA